MLALSFFAAAFALNMPDTGTKVDSDVPAPVGGMRGEEKEHKIFDIMTKDENTMDEMANEGTMDDHALPDRDDLIPPAAAKRTRRVLVSMLDDSSDPREECVKSIFGHRHLAGAGGCAGVAYGCNNAYVHAPNAEDARNGEYTLCVETPPTESRPRGGCAEEDTRWEYFCPASDAHDATAVLGTDGCAALAKECGTDPETVRGWSPAELEESMTLCCIHGGHHEDVCAGVAKAAFTEYQHRGTSYGDDEKFCHGMADLLDQHLKIAASKGLDKKAALAERTALVERGATALMKLDLQKLPNLAKHLAAVEARIRPRLPPGLDEDSHLASLLETREEHSVALMATDRSVALAKAWDLMMTGCGGDCDPEDRGWISGSC